MECKRCLYDTDMPGVRLDSDGICDYCKLHDRLEKENPISQDRIDKMVAEMKKHGIGKRYDCIIGLSGGVDSSYMLYLAVKKWGLRVLAVHFDNGWNTDVAEYNITAMVKGLKVDLVTIKARQVYDKVNKAYLMASVSDADCPNDVALLAVVLDTASKYNIKYNLSGHNFRTEGSVPIGWTFMNHRYTKDIYYRYYKEELKDFPVFSFWQQFKWGFKGIKTLRPLYHIDFNKEDVKRFLHQEFRWNSYGGKHCENIYTAFVGNFLLPKKFNIDKRIIELSALIRSGKITKEESKEELKKPIRTNPLYVYDVIEKYFNCSGDEFDNMMHMNRKMFYEFGDYLKIFKRYKFLLWIGTKLRIFPKTFYDKYTREAKIIEKYKEV